MKAFGAMEEEEPAAGLHEQLEAAGERGSMADWASALIETRQTILPKRLSTPGPTPAQLRQILAAAASAPDHGERLPWRFVVIPREAREALGEAFAQALLERDATATPAQVQQARQKAYRAPALVLAIARFATMRGDDIPADERLVSAGCAIQNMLLVATAQGFGTALTSGKAMGSTALRSLFGLQPHERALCFISIGTPLARKPRRQRAMPEVYVSTLGGAS